MFIFNQWIRVDYRHHHGNLAICFYCHSVIHQRMVKKQTASWNKKSTSMKKKKVKIQNTYCQTDGHTTLSQPGGLCMTQSCTVVVQFHTLDFSAHCNCEFLQAAFVKTAKGAGGVVPSRWLGSIALNRWVFGRYLRPEGEKKNKKKTKTGALVSR